MTAVLHSPSSSGGLRDSLLSIGPSFMMNSAAAPPPGARPGSNDRFRKIQKSEVAEAFLANLRGRDNINVDEPGFAESIRQHFDSLPSR
jgi:hypothetical protein